MINLTDYMDIINCDIKIKYHNNQNCRCSASFSGCETKSTSDDVCLTSDHGNGTTPDEVIHDYINSIEGKILIFNASDSKRRREYVFPENVFYKP